jgi:hypothetical protein
MPAEALMMAKKKPDIFKIPDSSEYDIAPARADNFYSIDFGATEPPSPELQAQFAEEQRLIEIGRKSTEAGKRGGRKVPPLRDIHMAREFKKRRPTSRLSDTALMTEIGAEHGLRRSTACKVITAALSKI